MSLRILFTSHYALPHPGGIEVVVDHLARALQQRGHDVTHLASDAGLDAPMDRPYRLIGIPSLNVLEEAAGVPVPLMHPRLVRELYRLLPRVDVVHAHGFLYPASATALLLARSRFRKGPARVLTEHVGHVHYGSAVLNGIEAAGIGTLGRAVVRSAEAVVVFNSRVEAELKQLAPGVRQEWIENGIDTTRFRPPDPGEKERLRQELRWDARPRVLFVGRLVAKKGIDLALAAAAAGDFELVVVGPGSVTGPLPSNAKLFGPRTPDELAKLYRAADAFLLPSRGEGFPITVQEAISSGLTAFVLDDPGYERYFETLGTALQSLPSEPVAMAGTLTTWLRLPHQPASGSGLDWDAVAGKHEALYQELLAKRSA
jgi:glycosyltransferase involved in cell wall biosynthesis